MDFQKINDLNDKIAVNTAKMNGEKDYKKREILKLKIQIDQLKVRLERLN
jgi:hypothetical protein